MVLRAVGAVCPRGSAHPVPSVPRKPNCGIRRAFFPVAGCPADTTFTVLPEAIWEALDPATKQAALQALARLLAGTVRRLDPQDPDHD